MNKKICVFLLRYIKKQVFCIRLKSIFKIYNKESYQNIAFQVKTLISCKTACFSKPI